MSIATEIYHQLGGKRFQLMTGATKFVDTGSGLSMHLKRNKSKANYLLIELTPMDTYIVTFKKFNKKNLLVDIIVEFENIYNDQLEELFTQVTGMYTRL
jgi:hypothetical protein